MIFAVLHRRRVMRDEDADIDTAAGAATTANVDDDLLLKAARSRRIARPLPSTYLTADDGNNCFSLLYC